MINFKIRETKETEPDNVVEIWLQKGINGTINIMASDENCNSQTICWISQEGRLYRTSHFIKSLQTNGTKIEVN